jgi:hypothetical protein
MIGMDAGVEGAAQRRDGVAGMFCLEQRLAERLLDDRLMRSAASAF